MDDWGDADELYGSVPAVLGAMLLWPLGALLGAASGTAMALGALLAVLASATHAGSGAALSWLRSALWLPSTAAKWLGAAGKALRTVSTSVRASGASVVRSPVKQEPLPALDVLFAF